MRDGVNEGTGGLVAGRYRIGERIREGRAFRLHEGTDANTGERVRIRFLRSYLAREAGLREAFPRLADSPPPPLPGLLRLLVVEDLGDTVALVEEAPEGICLADHLDREVVLSPADANGLVRRAARIVQSCHDHGVIHGLISPHEVYVNAAGGLYLAGCGYAAPFEGFGLPGAEDNPYLAPEQRRGEPAVPQSDVYALGVILLEALTGRQATPESLRTGDWRRGVSSAMQPVLAAALAESPHGRYMSAAAFAAALLALSAEEPVATPSEAPNEVAATPAAAPADERASREPAPRNRKTAAIPMTAWTRTASCVIGLIYASIIPLSVGVPVYLIYTRWMRNAPETVTVPDFQGSHRDLQDALADAAGLGLRLSVVDEVYDPAVAENAIAWQNPAPGKVVKEGFEIDVKISRGARQVPVPNVVNTSLEEAQRQIEEAGLRLGDVQKGHSRTFPQDIVFSQAPEPGSTIPEDGQVNLLTSLGPDPSENWEGLDDPAVASMPGSVRFEVPSSGNEDQPHRVQLKVYDQKGSRVVYDRLHMQGDTVRVPFTVMGEGRVEVIHNGEVTETKQLPE